MAFICLLSAAASAADFGWDPDIGAHKRFPNHAGFVAVQVVDNVETQKPGFPGWSGLVVERVDGPNRRYTLQGERMAISSGQIFVGTLPAGDYEIAKLWSGKAGAGDQGTIEIKMSGELAQFRVEPQRFTDLGTLVYQIGPATVRKTHPLVWFEKFPVRMQRAPARPGLLAWFRDSYPKLARTTSVSRVYDPQSGSYITPEQMAKRALGMHPSDADMAINSVARRLAGGELAMPGHFGQISMRARNGAWSTLPTGFSVDINDLTVLDEGLLIAGDRGLLAMCNADCSEWQAFADVPSDHLYYWVGQAGDGRVYALGHSQTRATLLRLSVDRQSWQQVARFSKRQGFRPALHKRGMSLLLLNALESQVARGYATRASVLSSDAPTMRIAVGSKRWRYRYADGKLTADGSGPSLATVAVQGNGTLLATSGSDIAELTHLYSTDRGNTWNKVRRPSDGHLAIDLRESSPYVDAQGRVVLIGPKVSRDSQLRIVASKSMHLLSSTSPRELMAWQPVAQMPRGCHRLLSSISSDSEFFVQCRDLGILRSSDGGETWDADRRPMKMLARSDSFGLEHQ